jgi:hypothetical protein
MEKVEHDKGATSVKLDTSRASPPATSSTGTSPVRSSRWSRMAAYLLSPKVLLGGILAYGATELVEAYKLHRAETREDVGSVRDKLIALMTPLPEGSDRSSKIIAAANTLYALYESEQARQIISNAIGELSNLRARQVIEERRLAEAEAAKLAAEQAAARAAEARQAEEVAAAEEERRAAEVLAQRRAADAKAATRAVHDAMDVIKKLNSPFRF